MSRCAICGDRLSHKADVRDVLTKGHSVLVLLTAHKGLPTNDDRAERDFADRAYQTEQEETNLLKAGWRKGLAASRCITGD